MPFKAKPSQSQGWRLGLKINLLFLSGLSIFFWNFMRLFFFNLFEKGVDILKMWGPSGIPLGPGRVCVCANTMHLMFGVICGTVWEGLLKAVVSQVDICILVEDPWIARSAYWVIVLLGLALGGRYWINIKPSRNPSGKTLPRMSYMCLFSFVYKSFPQTSFYLSSLTCQSVLGLSMQSFKHFKQD